MPKPQKKSKRGPRFLYSWRTKVHKSDLPSSAKLVLLTIAHFMSSQGFRAFPSMKLLSEYTSLSDKSVRTAVKKASEAGFIQISSKGKDSGKGWRHYQYTATFPKKDCDGFLQPDELKKQIDYFGMPHLLGYVHQDDLNKSLPKAIHPDFDEPGYFKDDGNDQVSVLKFFDGFLEDVFFYCCAKKEFGDALDDVWVVLRRFYCGKDYTRYNSVRKIEASIQAVEASGVRLDLSFDPGISIEDDHPGVTIERIPGRTWQLK